MLTYPLSSTPINPENLLYYVCTFLAQIGTTGPHLQHHHSKSHSVQAQSTLPWLGAHCWLCHLAVGGTRSFDSNAGEEARTVGPHGATCVKGRSLVPPHGLVPRNKQDGLCPGRLQDRGESIPFSVEMGGKIRWKCWNFSYYYYYFCYGHVLPI